MTQWEYARFEYAATGEFGRDAFMNWNAAFHDPNGVRGWGTDERFDDMKHLNRAGREGWQAYDRSTTVIVNPIRLQAVTYSMKRPVL